MLFMWGSQATEEPAALQSAHCLALVHWVRAMEAKNLPFAGVRLSVVTRAAERVAGSIPDPAQAPLRAFARVLVNEHPALEVRLIDVHAGAEARALAQEI